MSGDASIRYQRLPARGFASTLPRWGLALVAFVLGPLALLIRGARQELWDGGDHLLVVDRTSASERYRRFRYADIQSFQRWRTLDWELTAFILALAMTAFASLAAWAWREGGGTIRVAPLAVVAGAFLMALTWHLRLGATCRTRIQTAVQTLELPALGRVRASERALDILRDRVATAQGLLTAEDLTALASQMPALPARGVGLEVTDASRVKVSDRRSPPSSLRAHWNLVALYLATPVLDVLSVLVDSVWLDVLGGLLLLAVLIAVVLAFRAQRTGAWPPLLRALPWLTLANLVMAVGFAVVAMGVLIATRGTTAVDDLSWQRSPPILVTVFAAAVFNVVIGLAAIRELIRLGRRLAQARHGADATNPTAL